MSRYSVSTLPRISSDKLATLVRSKSSGLAVIDVRDTDFIGGHILGCTNAPTHTHDYRMPELIRTLKDKDIVVFHCALSQQRGPSSALRYLREREKLAEKGQIGIADDGEDKVQRVYVLEGGFVGWQQAYGTDKELTEGYVKDLWDEERGF